MTSLLLTTSDFSLRRSVMSEMSEHIDTLFAKCHEHLAYFVSLKKTPSTLNKHFLELTTENLVSLFSAARGAPPSNEQLDTIQQGSPPRRFCPSRGTTS